MNAIEFATRNLQYVIDNAADEREKFLAKASESASELIYQLEWAQSIAESQAKAKIAEQILAHTKDHDLLEILEYQQGELTKILLGDRLRGTSTSQFSNATEHAERAAASAMLERINHMVHSIKEEV